MNESTGHRAFVKKNSDDLFYVFQKFYNKNSWKTRSIFNLSKVTYSTQQVEGAREDVNTRCETLYECAGCGVCAQDSQEPIFHHYFMATFLQFV